MSNIEFIFIGLRAIWEDPLEEGMATHSVFLPGESHGQRSLAGHSPWGRKELDMNARLSTAQHTSFYVICLCPCLFTCFISTFSSSYILEK